MEKFIPVALIVIIIIAIKLLFSKRKVDDEGNKIYKFKRPKTKQGLPYTKTKIMSNAELIFFNMLKNKCSSAGYNVSCKVRLEDILSLTTSDNKNKWRGYIKSRHVDFVVFNSSADVVCVIELDDKSHNGKQAKKTDEFKNEVFKTAGIPLYRVKVGSQYAQELENIREL